MRFLLLLLPLIAGTAHANGTCFDLSRPFTAPPRASLPLTPGDPDASAAGANGEAVWAQRRGIVKQPLAKLRSFLEDPRHFKSSRVDEMTLTPRPAGALLAHHDVHSLVRPFPLVTVEWTDEWATSLLAGTPSRPEAVLIAYQKRAGTSHITRWCGTVLLTRVDDTTTDVAQFEEAIITGRSHDEMKDDLAGMLERLRTLP
ncbi:MAG: hypothetical protein IT383_29000 [Deltaproteobacteria bacterium]|nr:hypothetical protein [Deltaproteobacteria bacterium]